MQYSLGLVSHPTKGRSYSTVPVEVIGFAKKGLGALCSSLGPWGKERKTERERRAGWILICSEPSASNKTKTLNHRPQEGIALLVSGMRSGFATKHDVP